MGFRLLVVLSLSVLAGAVRARPGFPLPGPGIAVRAEAAAAAPALYRADYGELLPGSDDGVALWWAGSGYKVGRHRPPPAAKGAAVRLRAAGNEGEAAQVVLRPARALKALRVRTAPLLGPGGSEVPVDVLRVGYVKVVRPTDRTGAADAWPDPLPPLRGPIDLAAGENQPLWIRVRVPAGAPAGRYAGKLWLTAEDFSRTVPVELTVYGFSLPDRMTLSTAFGFSAPLVFSYQNLTNPADRRFVLDLYLEDLSAHHVSPYDPAPLSPLRTKWPTADAGKKTPAGKLEDALRPEIDFTAWDRAMARAIDEYHFNSFRLPVPGLGGGTFHSRVPPELLGHAEGTPEYDALLGGWLKAVQAHLAEKGWLRYAYVYWFDEPDPKDYAFVMNGFAKLKRYAPRIRRMLTEEVEPALIGGPDIWCPITPSFDPRTTAARRAEGETIWWYVCTGPKAPYCTLFIDHPATELRVWAWQSFANGVQGVLVWRLNYWTSSCAYPEPGHPQNPYEDPMSWVSGYDTPAGTRRPWGNGDGRFLYPPLDAADGHPAVPVRDGPVDSIRLEMLRDGIEDYEYLSILRRRLRAAGPGLAAKARARLEALLAVPSGITSSLTEFTTVPGPIERRRDEIARALESW